MPPGKKKRRKRRRSNLKNVDNSVRKIVSGVRNYVAAEMVFDAIQVHKFH